MILLSSADFFQNYLLQEFGNQDRVRHSVCPDLGPNCLQRLSAADKSHY